MSSLDEGRLQVIGREPIPGTNPGGEDAKYDPQFEELSAEMGKLESIEQQKVDWFQVIRLSSDLLETKTKDLKVGTWLAIALFRDLGYAGLGPGVGVLRGLVANFWDTMFPPVRRARARMTMLEWFAEGIEKSFDGLSESSEADRVVLERCLAELEGLDQISREKFTDESPSLGPAVRAVRAQLASIPEPVAEPEPERMTPVEPDPAPEPEPEPEPQGMTPEDIADVMPKWRGRMTEAAAILREADPRSPVAYRLLRESLWSDFHEPPETGNGRVPGDIDEELVTRIDDLLGEEEWEEVLALVESTMVDRPLWLDLNLYACRAAEGLGRKYATVRTAIQGEVVHLVRRLPVLVELFFEDGCGLASRETQVWIQNELDVNSAPDTSAGDDAEAIATEARRLLARKKLNEAVTLLVRSIDSAASRRDRFLLRLDLARLCMEAGNPTMAVPQLDLLDQEVQKFSLEEWEPDLSTQVVHLLWQCCQGKRAGEELKSRSTAIYERLCRLDPAAALTMKGP